MKTKTLRAIGIVMWLVLVGVICYDMSMREFLGLVLGISILIIYGGLMIYCLTKKGRE